MRRALVRAYAAILGHWYYSTACLHGRHDYCQAVRVEGRIKVAGRCKFCDAVCVCGCHREASARMQPVTGL